MSSVVLLGALAASTLGAFQERPGTVSGRILSGTSLAPIEGASVEIHDGARSRYLISGPDGAYRADGLRPGRLLVVARALDHAPLRSTVRLSTGGHVSLDFTLEIRPVSVPGLFTRVGSLRLGVPGLTRDGFRHEGETELRALESTPGVAELGLGANGHEPGDPTNLLYVRGAASDLKLVLLDGAPVYAPFHLSGLLDAFPDGVLEDASLYIGGTPARFDGGLSYVLDLDIREGNRARVRGAGALDLLGAMGRLEGPLGETGGFLLSGRALHGLGYPVVTGDPDLPYGYGDALGRLDFDAGPGRLSATGFWNRESVDLDIGKLEGVGAVETAYWGNLAGSVRYRAPLASGTLTIAGAYGRFATALPVPRRDPEQPSAFADARGHTARTRTEAYYESDGETLRWAAGAGFDTHRMVVDQRTVFGDTTAHAEGRAHVAAGWGEAIWRVAPEVELRTGVRADYFRPEGAVRVAPRATMTWHVSEDADLRLSAGRFFQVVRGPESILSSDLTGPTVGDIRPVLDSPGPLSELPILEVAGASHLVVGLENRLENGVEIGIEGYFKSFDDLPGTTGLSSSGADLWVQAQEGPVRGWVGYSLAWVWSEDSFGDTRFVGRQLLSGGLSTGIRGFDLGLRLAYGAGLPFAEVSAETRADAGAGPGADEPPAPALSGAPDDSYLRIDAEISRRWLARVGDSDVQIAPYLRLLNALDRRDALFYRADAEGPTRPVPLSSVPLIAVVGVSWSF